jgi:hypothetical protein
MAINYPAFKNAYGTNNAADKIANLDVLAKQLGYTGPHDNKTFQEWLYNSSPENKAIIDKWHTQYKGTGPTAGMFDGKIGIRWQNAIQELAQTKPQLPGNFTPGQTPTAPPAAPQGPTPNEVNTTPGNPITMNTGFTPEQKIAQAYANAKYATAKRYMPYRSHFNPSYVDASLMNPEQAVQDAQASTNAQIGALNSLNPMLRNAQAQSFAGQAFNQIAGIRSQYDNQNAQITNQNRAMNNQIRNNATGQNMENDQRYYQQSVVGRQNYDQLRGFLADQAMNTRTQHVQENEQLGWNLLTQKNPVYGFDFKTGKMYRNPNVNIMDADMGNNYRDDLLETATKLKSAGWSDALIGNLLKSRAFSQAQYRPNKKGGRLTNPYKK